MLLCWCGEYLVSDSPLWPAGAFPSSGIRNDSIVVGFPVDLPLSATNYQLQVRRRNANLSWTSWQEIVNDDKDKSAMELTELLPDSLYEVKVQYINNSLSSPSSSTVQVKTLLPGVLAAVDNFFSYSIWLALS